MASSATSSTGAAGPKAKAKAQIVLVESSSDVHSTTGVYVKEERTDGGGDDGANATAAAKTANTRREVLIRQPSYCKVTLTAAEKGMSILRCVN